MHIIHVASELAPVAKIGGLGDVITGLSRELLYKGHKVDIIIPKYDSLDTEHISHLQVEFDDCTTHWHGEEYPLLVWSGAVENLSIYFIESESPHHFFQRGTIYGCTDDRMRFLHFSRAVLDFLEQKDLFPEILHIHDWQTAAIAPLFTQHFSKKHPQTRLICTIHNLSHQGIGPATDLNAIRLEGEELCRDDLLADPTDPTQINLLKGGIVFSDTLTTVSPTYAREVLQEDKGNTLHTILQKHQEKFVGILNGVDYSYWNPEIDRYLSTHYSSREFPADKYDNKTLDNKRYLKKNLCEKNNLSPEPRPLVGCVTRLDPQKGIHLIKHSMERAVEMGGQFILLGSTTLPDLNRDFHQLQQHYSYHPYIHLILTSDEEMIHQIFAGSDIFIVPSLFEPCGLTQLIALKYGTIPVVRKTGGLSDTIFDVDHADCPFSERNGYTFDAPTEEALNGALDRAIATWQADQDRWRQIMVNAMQYDYSWHRSANTYLELYHSLLQNSLRI